MEDNNEFAAMLGLKPSIEELKNSAREFRKRSGEGCVNCSYLGYTTNYQGKHLLCECVKKKMLANIYSKANVPEIYFHKTIEEWNLIIQGINTKELVYPNNILDYFFGSRSKRCEGSWKVKERIASLSSDLKKYKKFLIGNLQDHKLWIRKNRFTSGQASKQNWKLIKNKPYWISGAHPCQFFGISVYELYSGMEDLLSSKIINNK